MGDEVWQVSLLKVHELEDIVVRRIQGKVACRRLAAVAGKRYRPVVM